MNPISLIARWLPATGIAALLALLGSLGLAPVVNGQAQITPETSPTPAAMDNARLGALVQRIDPNVQGQPGFWRFAVEDVTVLLITDERADRMRIISGIAQADALDEGMLRRLMQANFDSALDARYSIARDTLWSAFIHPLSPLDDDQFVSGLAQVVGLVKSYGTTFSSGGPLFGGGDSNKLIQELRDRALAI